MRVLLVNPTAPQWRVNERSRARARTRIFRFSMLSSLAVAAAMPAGTETRILDEEIEPVDFGAEADLVGISLMTYNAPRAYQIADRFRERGVPAVLGGFHPTFLPEEASAHADAVCVGEAERNVPRILEDLSRGRLQRFYREGPADLASLRAPDRRLLPRGSYARVDALQATRGCPYACRFCSVTAFHGGRFRVRPVAQVVEELARLGRYVLFMDDNIAIHREYARELFSAMRPLRKRWFSQCSLQVAEDPQLLALARASGCRGLFVGLESLSQENLDGWGKGRNRARDYVRSIARIHGAGIGVFAGVVFGGDGDGEEVFGRTLEFLDEARVDALQATILTPFPGTPLYAEMERQGRITNRDWSRYDFRHVVFAPAKMSPRSLEAGHDDVLRRFYSGRAVARRIAREFGYLPLGTVARGSAPLNLAYRARLRADGTIARGAAPLSS